MHLLEKIRILDLADEKACFCSKLFADLGAEVIKIEKPGGDAARKRGPLWEKLPGPERSLSFEYNNTNKSSVTLNLESPEGKAIFFRLIKTADAVVESFPPGYLEAIGLGIDALKAENPALILASITGFGQTGPHAGYKACNLTAAASGGQMYVSGLPASQPLRLPGDQSYFTASLYAAIGIMLALRRRGKNGNGAHLDISLQEAVFSSLEHVALRYFSENVVSRRQGRMHWNNLFYIFPCKDGFIQMTTFADWETLVEWLDTEGMAEDLMDERYRDETYRLNHLDHIIQVLTQWTRTHTMKQIFELGQLMGFPWAPVQSPKEIVNCPQLNERKFFIGVENPHEGGVLKYPGLPFKLSEPVSTPSRRAPRSGEDNFDIYVKELGFSEEELNALSKKGVT